MTNKEALERLYLGLYSTNEMANYYDLVLKALERLEVLENENKELKEYSFLLELSKQHEESKNEKLKKATENFINWIKEEFRKNDNQAILGKATYTNVVELALLTHILDKLKEYELLKGADEML